MPRPGLKDKIPLYGVATVLDEETLPGMGDAALGVKSAGFWGADLDNDANSAFVAAFRGEVSSAAVGLRGLRL